MLFPALVTGLIVFAVAQSMAERADNVAPPALPQPLADLLDDRVDAPLRVVAVVCAK